MGLLESTIALYLTQEVPQHLAEVGQRWECRVTSSLPCLRVADSHAMRKAGGQCAPGGCSGLKELELGKGVFWGLVEPPLLSCAKKSLIGLFLKGL